MAAQNFAPCLKVTLAYEGGWSDHPDDPGGATMKGVTIGRYRVRYPKATKADLKNITEADIQSIYYADYWMKVSGNQLPYGVDLVTFDYGVNSGPSRGVKALQAVVGVAQDGAAGPATISAAVQADGKAVIQRLCAKRLSFMQGLKIWNTFKRGWSRRVADVEAKAVAMWLAKGAALSAGARKELAAEAAKAGKTAKAQGKAGGGVAGGGVAGNGALAASSAEPNWLLIAGLIALVVVAAGLLILRSRHNAARADAYQQESSSAH